MELVEVFTGADVDDEKCFDDSFMKFCHKAKFCSDFEEFEVEVQAKLLKLKFGQYFAAEAW